MFELAPFALPEGYGEGILPLADVKAHCSIDAGESEFDDLLAALRDAAVDMVERYCSLYLAEREGVVWRAERLPPCVRLGVGPVTALTGFVYLDAAGVEQSFDVAKLRIGLGGEVLPKVGESWPSASGGVEITFTAGFTAETRPAALVQAARMFTAHLFANREAVSAGGSIGGEIPMGFRLLCSAYRMPVI